VQDVHIEAKRRQDSIVNRLLIRSWIAMSVAASLLLLLPGVVIAEPVGEHVQLSHRYRTGDSFMQIRLRGAERIRNTPLNGLSATELSGIAWDEDEQILYAVSDRGHLVHLRPRIDDDLLVAVDLIATHPLLSTGWNRLPQHLSDGEGLAIVNSSNGSRNDTRLLVSFEGIPRVDVYTPAGRLLDGIKLPPTLQDRENFRCRNCQLEAVTLHPQLGVVTAPQQPLRSGSAHLQSLYDEEGRVWTFPPVAKGHSAIVGLETAPDGSLLILERRYTNVFSPVIFAVRRLRPDPLAQPQGGALDVEEVARLNNTEGWMVDNFEGIAHHRDNRYFLVSDDNNSALQSTVLVYFEILD
jgi:hypothetical protein